MSDEPQKTPGGRATRAAAQAGTEALGTAANAAVETARSAADAGFAGMNEFARLFSEMKMPAMPDMQALMEAHRRNLETLSAANRVALEGAQAVARRHMEIMQQSMSELSEAMQSLASAEGPQGKAAKQAELLKRAYERAVTNMRELRDLIQRSNGEALELLNRRFTESLEEVQDLIRKASAEKA
jgi:phasin family protein